MIRRAANFDDEEKEMKEARVSGTAGFLGGRLMRRWQHEGPWSRGVDLQKGEGTNLPADESILDEIKDHDPAEDEANRCLKPRSASPQHVLFPDEHRRAN